MKRLFVISAFIGVSWTMVVAQNAPTPDPNLPYGWGKTGDNPGGYEFIIDSENRHGGRASASIKAKPDAAKEKFGSFVQSIRADNFKGKRIRLSGFMKTANVEGSGQFWIRVDGPKWNQLDFSNMEARPVKGNSDWTKYDLVVDVPQQSLMIVWGAFLMGPTGQIWIDDLKIESVGSDVAKTSNKISNEQRAEEERLKQEHIKLVGEAELERRAAKDRSRPLEPVNLDFEESRPVNAPEKKP